MREIEMKPELSAVDGVAGFVEAILEEAGISTREIAQIMIVVDEIISNIVRYSYAAKAVIGCEAAGGTIELIFKDDGTPYDPLLEKEPDIRLPAEERKTGGLGIHLVRKMTDEITYRYEGGYNTLTVRKNCLKEKLCGDK